MSRRSRASRTPLLAGTLLLALVAARPASAVSSVDEAHELLSDWQLEDALTAAQSLLAEDPKNPDVQFLAARVQHARGEHLSALSLARAAAEAGLAEASELVRLAEHSARYATRFESKETPHFSIRYLNKDELVAASAGAVLEAAYANIGADLEFLPAERGEKIVVEIYPDARGLAGATGLTVKEIETSGTIAVCKFHRLMLTSPLATANGYGWADTAAHEFVHLVISKKSRNTIPIWLHEGIAKFYESRWKGKAGEGLEAYSENLLAEATRSSKWITWKQMHPSMAKLPSQKDAALAFAQVFTVIEFLRDKYGPRSIAQVLALASQGLPLDSVLQKTFQLGLEQVESTWKKWVKKREFRLVPGAAAKRIELADHDDAPTKERPLETIPDREVHDFSRLGELLQLGGNHLAAVIEYEKAHRIAGNRFITLVNRLARAYQEVGRIDDAVKLLDEALIAHPDDADAHLLAGRLLMARERYDQARAHFDAVRLQNPFNPEIWVAYARLAERDQKPELAAQAKRFFTLAQKPRPTRTYELPPARAGNATLDIVSVPWGPVTFNGNQTVQSPTFGFIVEAGEHTFGRTGGPEKKVAVGPGARSLVLLQ